MSTENNLDHLAADEELSRARIAGWWQLLEREPTYPVPTGDVVALLQAVEYRCDGDFLLELLSRDGIPPVPRVNGKLAWSASHITWAAAALEARRRWVPFSNIHGSKFSLAERLNHIETSQGGTPFADLPAFDVEAILGLLVKVGGDANSVATVVEALRCKLTQEGVL